MKKTGTANGFIRFAKMENVLERINAETNWEIFRWFISWIRQSAEYSPWNPPWDEITMFKTTLLQYWNDLSDRDTEHMISDWMAFQRFLDLEPGTGVPDANTIRLFKQEIGPDGMKKLVDLFELQLEILGFGENQPISFVPKAGKYLYPLSANKI